MQRIILGTLLAIGMGGAALVSQHHVLAPEHIDRHAGELILRAGVSGGVNYAGVYLISERRWFVYQVEQPLLVQETKTTGVIDYWHNGFRVTFPGEKRALIFRRAGTRIPAALAPTPFDVTSYSDGYGIVHQELPRARERSDRDGTITIQDYCSPEYPSCGPFDQDPIGGSGGGPAPCSPASCSIGCASGTCEAACGSGYKAACKCNESNLTATCYCTRC